MRAPVGVGQLLVFGHHPILSAEWCRELWVITADEESNIRPQMGNQTRTVIPRSPPSPKTRRKTIVALDPGPPAANRPRCRTCRRCSWVWANRWLECPFGVLIWRSRNAVGVRLARLVSAHGGGRQRSSPATGASDERHSSKMHLKPRLKKRR
jgi:hypothetical protein